MVMSIPGDVAELPGARETAELRSTFEDGDALSSLPEAMSEHQPEHAAADDAPVFRMRLGNHTDRL